MTPTSRFNTNIHLLFQGICSEHVMALFINFIQDCEILQERYPQEQNRLIRVAMEMMQNSLRYKVNDTIGSGQELLDCQYMVSTELKQEGDQFCLCSSNVVTKEQRHHLSTKISSLLAMELNELKALYKEQRKSADGKHEKGAGIGLIEIVRNCRKELSYDFKEINNIYSLFELKVIIKGDNECQIY